MKFLVSNVGDRLLTFAYRMTYLKRSLHYNQGFSVLHKKIYRYCKLSYTSELYLSLL